jgi:hypothetical protein
VESPSVNVEKPLGSENDVVAGGTPKTIETVAVKEDVVVLMSVNPNDMPGTIATLARSATATDLVVDVGAEPAGKV